MSTLTLDTYLPYRLSVASNKVSGLIAKAYETRFSLTIPQWRVLVILSDGTALSQKGLIEASMQPVLLKWREDPANWAGL